MENIANARTVPLHRINIQDTFWTPYLQRIREVVLPYQWDVINDRVPDVEPSRAMRNFRIAAGSETGEFYGYVFQDTDIAKWLETVSYSLTLHPDPELEQLADDVIDVIANAQQPDGYLNTYFTIQAPDQRWTNLREAHELYTTGHFIEAAVAYYQATGKRKLLEVLCRFVDLIEAAFGPEPNKLHGYPGHQEIELALIKLYDVTGERRYLQLSKYFLDERGKEPCYFDLEAEQRGDIVIFPEFRQFDRKYAQAHMPVREQTTAEGHAVRAVYMYSAMADVARETGDADLLEACRRLWQNMTTRRMYITGGIGSTSIGEAFTFDYDLPNDTMYTETCASVGLVMFAQRMLLLEQDRRYTDVMERALYNNLLSGMSLDGTRYFYVNPLEVWPEASEKSPIKKHVKPERQKWYACACCPPNLARLLMSLGQYIYTITSCTIYTHLYISSETQLDIDGTPVTLRQTTKYPWEGTVSLSLAMEQPALITMALRIPGWCREARLTLNGESVELNDRCVQQGYAKLTRLWNDGDCIELTFSMPIEIMQANPQVRANIGKVAIMRGPIVFCLEEEENGSNLPTIALSQNAKLTASYDANLLGGTVIITGEAFHIDESAWDDSLYRPVDTKLTPVTITAIPYGLWGNRTPGEMLLWLRQI